MELCYEFGKAAAPSLYLHLKFTILPSHAGSCKSISNAQTTGVECYYISGTPLLNFSDTHMKIVGFFYTLRRRE